jgi:hypothetical protein
MASKSTALLISKTGNPATSTPRTYSLKISTRKVSKSHTSKPFFSSTMDFFFRLMIVDARIPKTRFFVTLYPKLICLSPGTSYNLPITFKPLENVAYDDTIKFHIDSGKSFDVQINGLLPHYDLDVLPTLDLGSCNAFESVSKLIKITNTT